MALIGKIRKNFWFVLILLGLALAAFVIMDAVSANNRGGLGAKQVVGSVAGQEIGLQEFQKTESALFSGNQDQYAAKDATWNYYVEKAIITKEADELGIGVSGEELMELQFGPNYSPIIQNNFRNQQTGQFDQQQLMSIKQQIESGVDLGPRFVNYWNEQQKQIVKTAKQNKLNNLVSKSLFTPSFVVESNSKGNSERVSFDYIKVPFDHIDNASVEVSDADINSYINDHKSKYYNDQETRVLEYAVMSVIPTSADSAAIREDLQGSMVEFEATTSDSIFAINNEGFYSPFYAKASDLNGSLIQAAPELEVGSVYGPYLDNGTYFAAKLLGKKMVADSAEARHILISTANGINTIEAAREKIDSLRTVLTADRSSFADLAKEFSDDPGSGANGGDLGYFTQGRMVQPFNDAVFSSTKKGGLYTVETQFGVHLIEVTDLVFTDNDPKYKFAYISSVVIPSQETQERLYDDISMVIAENRDLTSLRSAVAAKSGLNLTTTRPLVANDHIFGTLGSGEESRDAIKWAFANNKGDVSPKVYTYTDPVNYYNNKYVILGLQDVIPAGLPTASAIRSTVEPLVMNMKKAEMIAGQISSKDLSALATQYNTSIETINDAFVNKMNIPGLGNEPKVIATALGQAENVTSSPIIGNSGVYVVKTNNKSTAVTAASVPQQRKTMNSALRSSVNFSLLQSLKETFKPEDHRATFF